jgi:lipopolysaccharide export system protein LptA
MRRLRWLLPVAILAILGTVGKVYLDALAARDQNAPEKPAILDPNTQGQALEWCLGRAQGANPHVSVCAAKMKAVGDKTELQGVQLKLYHEGAKEYDLVTSDFALFDITQKKLYSDGNVEITLAVPAPPEGSTAPVTQPGRLLKIHSSGVEFSSETGAAHTERPVTFEFDRGGGSSVGAEYTPADRRLHMVKDVKLDWRGADPEAEPMHIEAGEAWYFESESKVWMTPWAKLRRGQLSMDAGSTVAYLKEGLIEKVEAENGSGAQQSPARKVEFSAKNLHLFFDEHMTVNRIFAQPNGRLVSSTPTAKTTVTGDILDLNFATANKESVLLNAAASGKGEITAEPVARAGVATPETRVLKSDIIHLAMRQGGEEIERVETAGPATLDFLPNRPDQFKRNLTGDKIWIDYGRENRIDRFRSTNAKTRTESKPPRLTESKEILAFFDAAGALSRMEQNTDFRYEEGDRRANSNRATYEQAKDLLTLEGKASTSDPSGRVNADLITLHEESGDFTAEGNVSTTRQPARKGTSSAMLSNQEITQATAKRMTSTNKNQRIHYEGNANAWQGANRVTANTIDIDQQRHIMEAHGSVVTQFADKEAPKNPKKAAGPPAFTIVRAAALSYNTETRIAHYTGGVHLDRPGLTVDSRELRAFLNDDENDSSLDKAIADGTVKIVSITPSGRGKRTRTGTSEHGEYYAEEQKVILSGGRPVLTDSEAATTTGDQLTWWADNDRLLVNGTEMRPVQTRVPKKK